MDFIAPLPGNVPPVFADNNSAGFVAIQSRDKKQTPSCREKETEFQIKAFPTWKFGNEK
jgi:hypothetical protein